VINQQPTELVESEVIARLRDRYLAEGYQFVVEPMRELIPSFLGNYRPDALALRGDGGVVIEVKRRKPPRDQDYLAELAKLFEDHPEWKFQIVLAENFGRESIPEEPGWRGGDSSDEELQLKRNEVEGLVRQGFWDVALVLAWSVFEAAARSRLDRRGEALSGWRLAERLISLGLLDNADLDKIRDILSLRSAISHGHFSVHATEGDVRFLLALIDSLASEDQDVGSA
jgi:hypothetical protein